MLAARPRGALDSSAFRLEETPVPEPSGGEVLLRTLWLSLDPYMRGRMSDAPSYAAPVDLGEPMTGGTVARVEQSRNGGFQIGDLVVSMNGWQDFAVSDGSDIVKLPPGIPRPSYALGVLGMPGFTAYIGLLDIGCPRTGDTLVVAAATGAVGSIVGQIGKIKGCRVVGIAGGSQKCDWAVRGLGFDACVDHHADGLDERLAAACPAGIDVYFENVGGKVLRAVTPLMNNHSRMPVCGVISMYNERVAADADALPAFMRAVLVKRIKVQGFIFSDAYQGRRDEFLGALGAWVQAGRIVYREDVVQGLEHAPDAFLGLLEGRNFGKLVVDVAGAAQ